MRNYLHQRSKSLLAFAVGLTILSSSFAGEVYADDCYFSGSDMYNDGTTNWDEETQTATLTDNKTVGFLYHYSKTWGSQSANNDKQGQCASLVSYYNPYNVVGADNKLIKFELGGDIIAIQNNKLTVDKLDTLTITNGTYGLFANYGYKTETDTGKGGLYLSNIKNVDISGTLSAIYSDVKGNVTLSNIGTLNLKSDFTHALEDYGKNLTATEDNTIICDYGSIVNINAKDTTITSTGRAILATAHNVDNINVLETSWGTDTPWPQVNINSDTLTIKAATSGPTAAAVYSDTGAIVNLGSADKKIKILKFDQYQDEQGKKIYANMNLYSNGYIYEENNANRYNRYSGTIAAGKTADDYILHQSQINVYAEYAEFNANTNAINARNNALINVNAENAVINNNYGNVATVSSSGGSTVSLTGDDLAITNHNTNYLKDANVIDAKDAKVAIGSGGIVNPSRQDLVEDYGGTVDKAGDIIINANKKLTVDGNIIIDAKPGTAAGNSISINKDNTTALVNITGDIYTNNGNEVHLSLGDGSAAGQNGNAAGRQAGRSTLTGAILDAASTAEVFSFSDANFSEKGTNLTMNSAAWNVTADSEVANVVMDGNSIIDLTQRNEATTVDMAGSSTHDHNFQKLKINKLSGSGTIKMDYDDSKTSTDGSSADKLFINNHSGTHCLYLNEVNGATSLTGKAEDTVLVSVVNENGDFKAASDDNLTWNIYELNQKESTTTGYNIDWYLAKNTNPTPAPQGPTRAEAATLKAHNMSYYLWRDQSERLTERLGITCFDEERAGVWTRMSNSSISGSGIYGSDAKVKTYTIGYDFKHNSDEQLTAADAKKTRDFSGLAFTYTKGSSSMNGYQVSDALQVAGGRSDIRGGALTAYNTHTSKSGSYADYVLRYSSYDNDFKLDGVNGSAKSHGLQASAEYGHRLENDHGLFVTPNAQFTLGRLYNKAFTTSNGVHVASDHLNSAILSMGVDVGQTLDDQSQVYAKVRYNTELGDRVSAAFYKNDASAFCNGDSNGSWWEYGLGFDLKAGHASHLFMDAERASGSGFSKDWSWRIGARFDF
ncbi:autotransporter outer membrane beta-barrel domain-containing protein [Phascolarctobacterium succinatutens]|uniref:autotransporter outer membrane beta-barrel domain-containing protein n=1 Tax=Phascolarctobacterium succinatutens TaxID=626940 RepID=UPI003FD6F2F8